MHVLRLFLIVCLLGALAGCFGDGRGDKKISDAAPAAEAGILVNAAVSGAAFATRTQSGLTGAGGQFTYARGEDITFTVGTIDLGTVQAAEILTPVELTGSNTPVDQSATNMFVFLQTIDENSPDYDDGIEISAATRTALEGQELNFDTDSETFTNNLQDLLDAVLPGKTIVSEEDALDNFCNGTYLPLGGQSTFGYPFPGCEDGSFELPDASGGDIGCSFSWDCFNSSFTNSNLFDDGNGGPAARTGTQVLKQFGDDGGAFQDVDATPGATYTASIWAQNWSGDPLNRLVILQLFFLDGSGNILEQNETFGTPLDPPGGANQTYLPPDTWVELSIQRVAPANTATARIQVIHLNNDTNQTGDPGGSVFWDDASLTGPGSTPPPTEEELLTNESYELPDASGGDIGCSFSWDCFNSSFTNSNLFDDGNGGPTARTGTQILKQFGDDGGAFQDVDAMPGETYTASIWAQNWSGDPLNRLVILQLFFLDGSGNILEQNETFGTPLDPPGGVNQTYLPPDTWVELSIQRVAPANTATARIQVIHLNNDTNQTGNPGGSVFWDDASLTGPVDDVPEGFELVFSDEFNDQGPVSPDSNKWTAEEGNGPPENPVGFGNNEWQEYTANLENLRVEDGNLVIQARCETTPCISETVNPGNGSITSAKIITRDKFEFQYGIVRARIKAAGGLAAWPAFWMLGADYPITPWPNAGEIDIMELFQNNSSPFETHSTIHFCNQLQSAPEPCNFSNGYDFITDSLFALERWSDDFHIYELEWNADRIIMRVDGDEVFNNAINPAYMEEFRKPFYLILNLAMGGNLGPGGNLPPDPNRTFIETSLIDWVRVYQPVP
jgi:beta-glucanase (GH16 family)